mmetsp:Transcript_18126/g.41118  ORF Transcript_18126/g.41118 Transcript_18126/m.41118 type:complete len:221 (+) Transcript_18126:468-1130(+)
MRRVKVQLTRQWEERGRNGCSSTLSGEIASVMPEKPSSRGLAPVGSISIELMSPSKPRPAAVRSCKQEPMTRTSCRGKLSSLAMLQWWKTCGTIIATMRRPSSRRSLVPTCPSSQTAGRPTRTAVAKMTILCRTLRSLRKRPDCLTRVSLNVQQRSMKQPCKEIAQTVNRICRKNGESQSSTGSRHDVFVGARSTQKPSSSLQTLFVDSLGTRTDTSNLA